MNNSNQKVNIKKIRVVPKWANVLSVVVTIIILAGIIESALIFNLNLAETTIISVILFIFYLIILAILQKPKTIVLGKKMPQKMEPAVAELEENEPTMEEAAPLKKETSSITDATEAIATKEIQEIKQAVSKTKPQKKAAKKKTAKRSAAKKRKK